MKLKKIEVQNFKSFDHLEVELGDFNVVIGPNASGKSNFVQLFRFLRDVFNLPLEDAISLQGGSEYLLNRKLFTSREFVFGFVAEESSPFVPRIFHVKRLLEPRSTEITYQFKIRFEDSGQKLEIIEEKLTLDIKVAIKKSLETVKIKSHRQGQEFRTEIEKPEQLKVEMEDVELYPPFLGSKKIPPNELFFKLPTYAGFVLSMLLSELRWEGLGRKISIYDIDPKLSKRPTPIEGRSELEENGSNLAHALKAVMGDPLRRNEFVSLVKYVLPFLDDVELVRAMGSSLLFRLKETYASESFPSLYISDGTVHLLALVIALYFGREFLVIIEEPERNLHPSLLYKVVEMMEDASKKKQIIATTHNPQIVRYAGLEHLFLLYRDNEGFSRIIRPKDKATVQKFLESEMGLEELYVLNLLEAP